MSEFKIEWSGVFTDIGEPGKSMSEILQRSQDVPLDEFIDKDTS